MALLASSGAHVLVIGGTAVRYYAPERREPNDLDLLIEPSEETARKVLNAMGEILGWVLPVSPEDLARPSKGIREKSVLNVDVMTPPTNFDFRAVWAAAHDVAMAYVSTPATVRVPAIPGLLAWLRYALTAEPGKAEAIAADIALLERAAAMTK